MCEEREETEETEVPEGPEGSWRVSKCSAMFWFWFRPGPVLRTAGSCVNQNNPQNNVLKNKITIKLIYKTD